MNVEFIAGLAALGGKDPKEKLPHPVQFSLIKVRKEIGVPFSYLKPGCWLGTLGQGLQSQPQCLVWGGGGDGT